MKDHTTHIGARGMRAMNWEGDSLQLGRMDREAVLSYFNTAKAKIPERARRAVGQFIYEEGGGADMFFDLGDFLGTKPKAGSGGVETLAPLTIDDGIRVIMSGIRVEEDRYVATNGHVLGVMKRPQHDGQKARVMYDIKERRASKNLEYDKFPNYEAVYDIKGDTMRAKIFIPDMLQQLRARRRVINHVLTGSQHYHTGDYYNWNNLVFYMPEGKRKKVFREDYITKSLHVLLKNGDECAEFLYGDDPMEQRNYIVGERGNHILIMQELVYKSDKESKEEVQARLFSRLTMGEQADHLGKINIAEYIQKKWNGEFKSTKKHVLKEIKNTQKATPKLLSVSKQENKNISSPKPKEIMTTTKTKRKATRRKTSAVVKAARRVKAQNKKRVTKVKRAVVSKAKKLTTKDKSAQSSIINAIESGFAKLTKTLAGYKKPARKTAKRKPAQKTRTRKTTKKV